MSSIYIAKQHQVGQGEARYESKEVIKIHPCFESEISLTNQRNQQKHPQYSIV